MPFDCTNNEGGGGDHRHNGENTVKAITAARIALANAGREMGLCASCTMRIAALAFLTDGMLRTDAEHDEEILEQFVEDLAASLHASRLANGLSLVSGEQDDD